MTAVTTMIPALIPAAPSTYIVELGPTGGLVLRTPVIAWAPDAENHYRAPFPVTAAGLTKVSPGKAILHPCGMVHDPEYRVCFETIEEWKPMASKRSVEDEAAPVKAKEAPVKKVEAPTGLRIEWITKPFKTNSFYRYTDDELDFIFQVDGGMNPPKQVKPVEKIKRDDFMSLKKIVDVAEYEDLIEGRAPGLDDIGSFEDDDDDLMGVSESPEVEEEEDDLI